MNNDDSNKTQLMQPETPAVDPDATVLAPETDPDATVLSVPEIDPAPVVDPDATVLAAPEIDPSRVPNPDATVLATPVPDADATVLDPELAARTRVIDAPAPATSRLESLPTTEIPSAATPTTVLISDDDTSADADGIDALDDPYRSPVALEDLTSARMPVQVESPVKSLRKRRLPVWAIILIIVVLLGAGGFGAWYTYEKEYWGGKTVPQVIGLDEATAREVLEDAGFAVEVQTAASDTNIGTVVSCTPDPGKRADTSEGAVITVAVARTVPDVVGMTMEDAKEALLSAGAQNIRIQSVNSDAESGTVVACSLEAGATFLSGDEIVLDVATPYVVPSVVGLSESDAKAAVEKAGLTAEVVYVKSDEPHNTVVMANPSAGTQMEEGGVVRLQVSDPYPSSANDLLAYFSASSKEVAKYLSDEEFSLVYGSTFNNGDAHAVYSGKSDDVLTFTANPETGTYPGGKTDDVLASGAPISGVRYVYADGAAPSTSETAYGVSKVMEDCGLDGLKETVDQDDLADLGFEVGEKHFICAYGESGNYSWAVIIGGDTSARSVVVSLASLKSHFNGGVDLADYDNSPAKYIAYSAFFADEATDDGDGEATDGDKTADGTDGSQTADGSGESTSSTSDTTTQGDNNA